MDLVIKNEAEKFTDKVIMTDKISTEAIKHGLNIHNWYDQFAISPPLIITEKEVDEAIEILDKVLKIADKEVGK